MCKIRDSRVQSTNSGSTICRMEYLYAVLALRSFGGDRKRQLCITLNPHFMTAILTIKTHDTYNEKTVRNGKRPSIFDQSVWAKSVWATVQMATAPERSTLLNKWSRKTYPCFATDYKSCLSSEWSKVFLEEKFPYILSMDVTFLGVF